MGTPAILVFQNYFAIKLTNSKYIIEFFYKFPL